MANSSSALVNLLASSVSFGHAPAALDSLSVAGRSDMPVVLRPRGQPSRPGQHVRLPLLRLRLRTATASPLLDQHRHPGQPALDVQALQQRTQGHRVDGQKGRG